MKEKKLKKTRKKCKRCGKLFETDNSFRTICKKCGGKLRDNCEQSVLNVINKAGSGE